MYQEQTHESSSSPMNNVFSSGEGLLGSESDLQDQRRRFEDELQIIPRLQFEFTYASYGISSQALLLFTRFLSLLFFILAGVVYLHERSTNSQFGWWFFTTWNIYLLIIFYSCATVCSVIGMRFRKPRDRKDGWSTKVRTLGNITHILFQVCTCSAFFITTVVFTLLDNKFTFPNMTQHLFTTCSIFVEFSLNTMRFQFIHVLFMITWVGIYMFFIWGVVHERVVKHWPYPFLDVDSWACFIWYSALVVLVIVYWYVLNSLSNAKMNRHEDILKRKAERSGSDSGEGQAYMKESLLANDALSYNVTQGDRKDKHKLPISNESLGGGPIVGIYTSRYTESGTELA